jgi:hypothetical protein
LRRFGWERRVSTPGRLAKKDAHDVYRLLVACTTRELSLGLQRLRRDALSAAVTDKALDYLRVLFATGPDALGASLAGQAEEGVGDPQVVAASAAVLAGDLIGSVLEH